MKRILKAINEATSLMKFDDDSPLLKKENPNKSGKELLYKAMQPGDILWGDKLNPNKHSINKNDFNNPFELGFCVGHFDNGFPIIICLPGAFTISKILASAPILLVKPISNPSEDYYHEKNKNIKKILTLSMISDDGKELTKAILNYCDTTLISDFLPFLEDFPECYIPSHKELRIVINELDKNYDILEDLNGIGEIVQVILNNSNIGSSNVRYGTSNGYVEFRCINGDYKSTQAFIFLIDPMYESPRPKMPQWYTTSTFDY